MKKVLVLALFALFIGSVSLTAQAQTRDGSGEVGLTANDTKDTIGGFAAEEGDNILDNSCVSGDEAGGSCDCSGGSCACYAAGCDDMVAHCKGGNEGVNCVHKAGEPAVCACQHNGH